MSDNKNFFKWIKDWFKRNKEPIKEIIENTKIDSAIKPDIIKAPKNIGWYSSIRNLKLLYPKANDGDIAKVGNETYIYKTKWIKQEKFP